MKAAGRTLTVGELREALAGLRDDDPVTVTTYYEDRLAIVSVEPASGGGAALGVPVGRLDKARLCPECEDEVGDE